MMLKVAEIFVSAGFETDLRDSSSERGGIFRKPSELIVSYIQCIGSFIGGGLGNPFLWGVKKFVTKLTSTNGIKSENRITDHLTTCSVLCWAIVRATKILGGKRAACTHV